MFGVPLLVTRLSGGSYIAMHLRHLISFRPALWLTAGSSMAETYHDNNEKTTSRLIEEVRLRLDWIGVDFLDEDDNDDEEGEAPSAQKKARIVRLLDYACGPGMMSRVSLPHPQTPLKIKHNNT
jgi:hypothetical protein